MLQSTFLGHQGWLFSDGRTRILVDPLLTPSFGHGGDLGRVYPPRSVQPGRFPAVDAVVLTHEHDDHFDLPSLHRLHRQIPIHLASRASRAAFEVLAAMGFRVHPLEPDAELELGGLRYRSLCADHRLKSDGSGDASGDEWEVSPYLVLDAEGHCALSSVDLPLSPRLITAASEVAGRPHLWIHANNLSRTSFLRAPAGRPAQRVISTTDEAAHVVSASCAHLLRRRGSLAALWAAPALTAVVGGGWSFPGDRAWMNHELFPVSNERLAQTLAAAHPEAPALAPAPGFTATFAGGRLQDTQPSTPFLAARPRERWPARDYRGLAHALPAEFPPVLPAPALPAPGSLPALARALEDALQPFAESLYAGSVFRAIYSLPPRLGDDRLATFCLALREDLPAPTLTFAYDPRGCRFERVDPDTLGGRDPASVYSSGLECWARDLLALLRGDIGPSALCFSGAMASWNHDPRLRVSPHLLWTFAHPLRRPRATARLYARLLAELAGAPGDPHVPNDPHVPPGLSAARSER